MNNTQTLNKYEIVSQLRKYKHEMFDLSLEELDVILPLIKGFIYSIDVLKEAFELKLQNYNDVIKTEAYKNAVSNTTTYMKKILNHQQFEEYEYMLTYFEKHSMIYLHLEDARIPTQGIVNSINLFFFSIKNMLINERPKIKSFDCDNYFDIIIRIIGDTLDFKIFDSDEFTPFIIKKINFLKTATYNVLSHLENVALNNEEEATQVKEGLLQSKLPPQYKRVFELYSTKKSQGETVLLIDDIANVANITPRDKKNKANNQKKRAQDIISDLRKITNLLLSEYDKDIEGYRIL